MRLRFIFVRCSIEKDLVREASVPQSMTNGVNNSPIVGILAQETSYALSKVFPGQYKSFIAASYVKFLEASGARVVPIWIGKDFTYYEEIISRINGILFPGGATWFYPKDGYADAGEHIFKIAKSLNDKGDYFPLWGTCLGFELLLYLSDNREEHRDDCDSHDQQLCLDFKEDFKASKLFRDAPEFVINVLKTEEVTANYHRFCFTEKRLIERNLTEDWRIIALNKDINGKEFVSVIESNKYPFYGVQFHPEKNAFEWNDKENVDHSIKAITANRYFADFFINETRKSMHSFEDEREMTSSLIYNYPITFTGGYGNVKYFQCYLFS